MDDKVSTEHWADTADARSTDRYYRLRSLAAAAAENAEEGSEQHHRALFDKEILSLHVIEPWLMDQKRMRFGPMFGYDDGSGWPDYSQFTDELFDHCRTTAASTDNLMVRALYLDLLWEARREYEQARMAIGVYEQLFDSLQVNSHDLTTADAICRGIQLAWTVQDDESSGRLGGRVVDELTTASTNAEDLGRYLWPLVQFVQANVQHFDQELLLRAVDALDSLIRTADLTNAETDFHNLRRLAEVAAGFYRRLQRKEDAHGLEITIGELMLAESAVRGESVPFLRAMNLQAAIKHFNNIGEPVRAKELHAEALQAGLETEQDMGVVSSEFEVDLRPRREAARRLLSQGIVTAVETIVTDPSSLPNWEEAAKLEEEHRNSGSLLSIIPRTTLSQGRQVHQATSEEEIQEANTYFSYSQSEALGQVLFNASWGELHGSAAESVGDLIRLLEQGVGFASDDLRILGHALQRYFAGDYLSFIHLVVPRIEAAIVRTAIAAGSSPTKTSANRTRKIDVGDALSSPRLSGVLGPEIVRWLDFVLANERHGMALRHYVSHGLLPHDELNQDNANRLLRIVFWLACVQMQ